jgi:radical SAM superfamily enzyme YgiQ (UPF0313 family)
MVTASDQLGASEGPSLSRTAVLIVDPGVLRLAGPEGSPAIELGPPRLLAIEALAAGDLEAARRHLAEDASPVPLLEELDAAGYLLEPARRPDDEPAEVVFVDRDRPSEPVDSLVLPAPLLLRITRGGFESYDHAGRLRARLGAVEVLIAAGFRRMSTPDEVFAAQRSLLGGHALDRAAFDRLVDRLVGAELLHVPSEETRRQILAAEERAREDMGRALRVDHHSRLAHQRFEAEALEQATSSGRRRPVVVPVNTDWRIPPMSLGLLVAYAKSFRDGELRQHYGFDPRMFVQPEPFLADLPTNLPGVYLFSNYIWCTEENLRLSAGVRATNAAAITIHGGPNTPKYREDAEAFFAANPHVDITVRGEGEETLAEALWALRDAFGSGPVDLSPLRDVPGLSFRLGDEVVHTGPRDRLPDLDVLPSPILTGLFDDVAHAADAGFIVIETNRGCPYGCTFCDWGSATLSRIRKFDLERVKAELEWCAQKHIGYVVIGDANFGIFERDVEIAEHIAALRATYGYPLNVGTNYAKNTVKHLSRIIDVFTGAGILAEGKVSLQTHDEETLLTIKRKNIKVEKYDDLAVQFRRNGLPLAVELMMGLPGSTAASFRADLQECIDRDVRAMVYPTVLLPNSPMNTPEYRAEHGIVADVGQMVKESASFTRDEWEQMYRLTKAYIVCETFGALRQVATFVRSELGIKEVAFYEALLDAVQDDPERFPITAFALDKLNSIMAPPVSWALLLAEVRTYLVDDLGVADSTALDAAVEAQLALLPARDRLFPDVRQLPHDYQGWHARVVAARGAGHRPDWETVVPRLGSLPPAPFEVTDPSGVSRLMKGQVTAGVAVQGGYWEFGNPVSRPIAHTRDSHRPSPDAQLTS